MQSSRRRLRVRPLRAGDARPRVRELGDEDRQLRGRRRTKERTDGRPRAAGGERERTLMSDEMRPYAQDYSQIGMMSLTNSFDVEHRKCYIKPKLCR